MGRARANLDAQAPCVHGARVESSAAHRVRPTTTFRPATRHAPFTLGNQSIIARHGVMTACRTELGSSPFPHGCPLAGNCDDRYGSSAPVRRANKRTFEK